MRPVAKYWHAKAHEAHHATVRAIRRAVGQRAPWVCGVCEEVVK